MCLFRVRKISVASRRWALSRILDSVSLSAGKEKNRRGHPAYLRISRGGTGNILLDIECNQRQVEKQRDPVSVDQEKRGKGGVDSGFRDDVGVETIAEVDGVDVIAFQVRVPGSLTEKRQQGQQQTGTQQARKV